MSKLDEIYLVAERIVYAWNNIEKYYDDPSLKKLFTEDFWEEVEKMKNLIND